MRSAIRVAEVPPVREELWSALRRAKAPFSPLCRVFGPQLPRKRPQVRTVAEHVSGVPQIFVSGLFLVVYLGMARSPSRLPIFRPPKPNTGRSTR